MTYSLRSPRTIITAMFMLAVIATTAHAQNFSNPPCPNVTVNNTSGCTVNVNLVTVPAGFWLPFVLAPGTSTTLPIPINTMVSVTGVIDINGVFFPTSAPRPPVGSPCGPSDWWTPVVPMAGGCLVTFCLDPTSCTITIF